MKQYLFLLLIFLTSCAAKKQAAEFEAQPIWMKQKPLVGGYYIGVGSSKKVGPPSEYKDLAKRDAMANLSEEISVSVSSTSVMRTIETNRGIVETFDQRIQIKTDDYLEGFEPVDFYEDESSYWVYYRLKESTYHEKKAFKKQVAIKNATGKYAAGLKEQEFNQPAKALTFHLQGLESIYNYLEEETATTFYNENIDVGNALYSSMRDVLSGLEIISLQDQITFKRGETYKQSIMFQVLFNDMPAQSIPVKFKFTGSYLNIGSDYSDENGFVQINNEKTGSKKDHEFIYATIDVQNIASRAVDNLFIRGLINDFEPEPASVTVQIEARGVSLDIPPGLYKLDQCEDLERHFTKLVVDAGFDVKEINQADFIFDLNYKYRNGESAAGLFSVYLTGDLVLKGKDRSEIWSVKIREIKGVAEDMSAAKGKATAELINKLSTIYFKQGIAQLK